MLGNQLDEKKQIFTWKMACEITISIHFKRVVLRFQENMKGSLLPEVATRLALHEKKNLWLPIFVGNLGISKKKRLITFGQEAFA